MTVAVLLRRLKGARRARARRLRDERGFGLVESLMSIGIAASGLMAVAGLMAASANLQMRSRDAGRSGMAAVQQLERLRILPLTDPRVAVGGHLTADAAVNPNDYKAVVNVPPAGLVEVRWQVSPGPAGSLEVAVRATPLTSNTRTSEVRSLIWRP